VPQSTDTDTKEPTTLVKRRYGPVIAAATTLAVLVGLVPPAAADGIAWHDSLDDATKAARESGKLVMLNLYTPMCGWCAELRKVTWPADEVVAKSAEFECVQADPTGQAAYDSYNNGSFPRILFLTPDGEIVHEVPGFVPPEPFVGEMDRAQKGARKLEQAKKLDEQAAGTPDDPSLAHQAAKAYLEVHPSHAAEAVRLLEPVYAHLDKLDEAQRPEASLDYGVALLLANQAEKAETVIAETLERYHDPELALRAGKLYLEFQRPDLAAPALKPLYGRLAEIDEELRPEVAFDYGIALLLLDELEESAKVLESAVAAHPDHSRVWQGRFVFGLALANLDKLAEAREQWEKVAEGDPDGPFAERARNFIEQIDQRLGEG
jgi:thioredoxin-related protein